MRLFRQGFILITFLFMTIQSNAEVFHLNTLGYLPHQIKVASVSESFETFQLINSSTQKSVFEGKSNGPFRHSDMDVLIWKADFSEFSMTGTYYLKLDNGSTSPEFSIASDVYNFAFTTATRAFYLWRCGTKVEADYKGNHFSHKACHLEDGWLDSIGFGNKKKDGTGGWHDAGDHGKYIVNAGITVGMLFMTWDQFHDRLIDYDLGLPETSSGLPEFLQEIKWETDWVLKMAYPDGSGRVSHKLTRTYFSDFIMPDDDHEKRYFTEWSSAATASYVAILAQAARYFKPFDEKYAAKCLDAALLSYQFLKDNPEYKRFEQGGFSTGGYQSFDNDDRLWAAVELWETIGDVEFLKDFEERLSVDDSLVDENWDWSHVKNMGTFTYLRSKRKGRSAELVAKAEKAVIDVAETIIVKDNNDLFNRPLGSRYYWGCNGTVARQVMNLRMANFIHHDVRYTDTALDAIHHLFGRNVYGRSYVTGLGYHPPLYPHDRRSGADGIDAPWPGYLVGGGHSPSGWIDEEASYATNEIAINWQAALVYALSGFIE